ncbi:hypothetical protein BU17DRAFT_62367 [Hysterangium stoloniferum]|nr:hypothetical protein BU17DRAFT_62367 [Hysterangium stoloniferum]
MSHLSPTVFVTWAILVACMGGFYFYHLWKFDRFSCLKFRHTRDGAFKRVMTYSYLVALPFLMIYTVGFAVIKYREGYIVIPETGQGIMWSQQHQKAYFPLNVFWALSWIAEVVSHLEGPSPKPWFKSIYFKLWLGGCITAFILLTVVTGATKSDPLKNEVYIQFAGSTIGLFITLGILPVLWIFPAFIQSVKNDGGDMESITRLAKFHDLNIIRTVFRFFFVVPVLMLSIDGMIPHKHTLNESLACVDFLSILSGIGCTVQSVITLMIFFPRNVEMETQRWIQGDMGTKARPPPTKPRKRNHATRVDQQSRDDRPKYLLTDSPVMTTSELPSLNGDSDAPPYTSKPNSPYPPQNQDTGQSYSSHSLQKGSVHYNDKSIPTSLPPVSSYSDYDRGLSSYGEDGLFRFSASSTAALTESNLHTHATTASQVNPMALYFTSPLGESK